MNNKEWIKQVLARKGDGRVPFNISMTPPARQLLEKHFGGLGLKMLREILTRLRNRYGKRLQWMTPLELIDWGERLAAQDAVSNRVRV